MSDMSLVLPSSISLIMVFLARLLGYKSAPSSSMRVLDSEAAASAGMVRAWVGHFEHL